MAVRSSFSYTCASLCPIYRTSYPRASAEHTRCAPTCPIVLSSIRLGSHHSQKPASTGGKTTQLTRSTFFPSDAASRRLRSTFKKIELYLIRNFWLKCPLGTIDNYRVLNYLNNAVKQRISKNEDSLWQWWWNKQTINRKQPFLLIPFRVSLGGLKSMKSHCWWRIKETFGWDEDGWDEDSWSYTEATKRLPSPSSVIKWQEIFSGSERDSWPDRPGNQRVKAYATS